MPPWMRYAKFHQCLRWGIAVAHRILSILFLLASTVFPLGALQAQTTLQPPDTMAARVLACASCHGAEGEGTSDVYFPRLAGKPAGYLYNQLVAFRDGRRKYPPMNYLLDFLPDPYLKQMAEHFASLRPPFPAPAFPSVSNDILARGEAIAVNGDPQRGIPACASLPRRDIRRHGAGDPRSARPARQLHQRAARRLALRHPDRGVAGLHADHCRPFDRRRRQGRCGLSVVASRADGPVLCQARQPADAACLRQPAELKGEIVPMPRTLKALLPAFLAACSRSARRPRAGAGCGPDRQRRIPRPRRRLHRLPHRARRQVICRRPADADAVRHALYLEHHARSADRHRHVDVRPVLPDDARRAASPTAGWSIRRCRSPPTPR